MTIQLKSGAIAMVAGLFFLQSCGTSGSGTPTKTGVGTAAGAATGAAVGQAVGGKNAWWIGGLTGAAVGGAAGNAWGRSEENKAATTSSAEPQQSVPYGTKQGDLLRSPYSDYSVNLGGRTAGETVFDPNTGKYFKVP
jgi:phage tail tape-measure protein